MYTLPSLAATAGVNRSSPATVGFTSRGAVQVDPPSVDSDSTMSFRPAALNRVSCQATYMVPVTGSMAAAGRPPVRMPGTPAPSNWPTVTGLLQVTPPSWEVCAVSKSAFLPGTNRSYTIVTAPSAWTSGSRPSVSAFGSVANTNGDQVLPSVVE